MSEHDSDWLLQQLEATLGLPGTRSAPTDAQLYTVLSNAQRRMVGLFATHVPHSQYGPPEKLLTEDDGYTYTFAYSPLGHAELRESRTGVKLYPAPEWADGYDGYVMEGQTIRWPGNRARTFSDGPYARYVRTPGPISATSPPTLMPPDVRMAIVFDAAREWAGQGGNMNPDPYKDLLQWELWGDPQSQGHTGSLAKLKSQYDAMGHRIIADNRWYRGQGWTHG
jgi:hypothetical protein